MFPRPRRLAALSVLALVTAIATAAAGDAVTDGSEAIAPGQVMIAYRVVQVMPGSLVELGLALPDGDEALIAPGAKDQFELDILISSLEDAKKARIVSRPMLMLMTGERAEIKSTGRDTALKLTTRVEARGEAFSADVVLSMSSEGEEPIAFQRDGIELPASIVRCPKDGNCVAVFVHAWAQSGK